MPILSCFRDENKFRYMVKNARPRWFVNKPYLNIWCGCDEEKICLVESFWIMKLFRFLDGWMSWTSQGRFSVVIEWSSFFGNHVSHQQQIYTFTCIWYHQDMCHSIMKKWKYVMENNWNYWRPKATDGMGWDKLAGTGVATAQRKLSCLNNWKSESVHP